ncbi:putative membrane protein YfcA [Sporomusaceae bacterium BoRhaA]|nr:putative membrane protein YfcA [Pelorhabdus rhamnosifermentans]
MVSMLAYLVLGFAIGTFGTLVGIGGGVILIPIFLLIFNWAPQQAIGTSLTVVFLNALSGSIAYIRQKKVYYDAAIRFSLATLPGAIIGSYLAEYFTGSGFRITFGILLMIMALLMYFRPSKKGEQEDFDKATFTYNRTLGVILSAFVGFLSSILGIGGGIIHVPAMIFLLAFPTHIATATSHFVLAISSFFGVAVHFFLGNILMGPALFIGGGAVAGAQFGAFLSVKAKSKLILTLLSLALFALGVRLLFAA